MSEFPNECPSLVSERISLRELTEADIPGWYRRATDYQSALLAGDPIPNSMEEGSAWLSKHRLNFRKRQGLRWAISETETGESIGSIGLTLSSAASDHAEFSIVIAREHWSRGIGQAATGMVLDYAFEKMRLRVIEADVLSHNVPCRKLLENSGFIFVELFVEQLPSDPAPVELCHYECSERPRS